MHLWLKNYVYLRCYDSIKHKKPPTYAVFVTYATSAFWHGFYPSYYQFFVSAAFLSELSKKFYKIKDRFEFIPPVARAVIAQ